jgi:nitroreductase
MDRFWIKLAVIAAAASFGMVACSGSSSRSSDNQNEAYNVIMSRKSVREYTSQQLSDGQIDSLLRAGMAAPSAMNIQPWELIVVTDSSVKAKIGDHNRSVATAPVTIVVCADTVMNMRPHGQPDAEPTAQPNPFWQQDASAVAENILLAAESMGLGAVWTSASRPDRAGVISEALGLPANIHPLAAIAIGYPAGDNQPKDKWKESKVHYNKW